MRAKGIPLEGCANFSGVDRSENHDEGRVTSESEPGDNPGLEKPHVETERATATVAPLAERSVGPGGWCRIAKSEWIAM